LKTGETLPNEAKFEDTSVTEATVVSGLGYPADRKEVSAEPTGWIESTETETSKI
jgi:hypothetical protein